MKTGVVREAACVALQSFLDDAAHFCVWALCLGSEGAPGVR